MTGWSPAQIWDPRSQQVWEKQKEVPVKKSGCEDRGKQQKDAQRQVSKAVCGNGCNFHSQCQSPGQQEVCPGLCKKGLLISMKIYRCFLTALKQFPPSGISCCIKLSGQNATRVSTGAAKQRHPWLNCRHQSERLSLGWKDFGMLRVQ